MTADSSQGAQGAPAPPAPQSAPAATKSSGGNQLRIAVLVVVAAIIGVGLWLYFSHDSKNKPSGNGNVTTAIGPKAETRDQLSNQSAKLGLPIYWIGPKKNTRYEFTRTTKGRLYVRYLPKGVGTGKKEGQLVVVATYPWPGAYAALKKFAHNRGITGADGSFITPARVGDSKSVLVAYPHGAYEIEVYAPKPGKAEQIAASGSLSTVG